MSQNERIYQLWIKRINIIMSTLLKSIYKFMVIPIRLKKIVRYRKEDAEVNMKTQEAANS